MKSNMPRPNDKGKEEVLLPEVMMERTCPICLEEFDPPTVVVVEESLTKHEIQPQDVLLQQPSGKDSSSSSSSSSTSPDIEEGIPHTKEADTVKPPSLLECHEDDEKEKEEQEEKAEDGDNNCNYNNNNNNETDSELLPTLRPLSLAACRHTFCQMCLVRHVGHAVETRQIPLVCPERGCREPIPLHAVQTHLFPHCPAKTVHTYQRYQEQALHPTWIPCTKCQTLCDPDDGRFHRNNNNNNNNNHHRPNRNHRNAVQCPACHHVFCRIHGDLHSRNNMTCAQFEHDTVRGQQYRESERAIRQYARPCSRCGALLQKAVGCDYIVCAHCRADMCWKCGTHIYLQGDGTSTVRRCQQCRSTYHREMNIPLVYQVLLAVLLAVGALVVIVVWPVGATLVLIATGCCGGCFQCGRQLNPVAPPPPQQQQQQQQAAPPGTTTTPSSGNPPPPPPRQFQPLRGITVTLVFWCLPLAFLLDGAYLWVTRSETGFLERLMPESTSKTAEIPILELPTTLPTATTEEDEEKEEEREEEEDEEETTNVPIPKNKTVEKDNTIAIIAHEEDEDVEMGR